MNQFKQLRIRAYLRTPVVSDKYLPLDAVLYYHLVRREMGEEIVTKSGESNVKEGACITLPIKKAGRKDETWFYSCSFAQWSKDVIQRKSFETKQGDWLRFTNYLSEKTKRIDNTRGKFKAYHMKFYTIHAEYVEWFCVGVPEELSELLQFCTHLGKNTSSGYGAVKNWEIIEWPEDWSIRGAENKLMRAVPANNSPMTYGLRPSYWNPRHIFSVLLPK